VNPMTDQQAETAGPGTEGPLQDVDAQSGDLDRRLAELEDRWRRAAADLDNMRKRVAGDSARQREAGRAGT